MNKTEIKRLINKRFYIYINESFPEYDMDFNEGGGRVYLNPIGENLNLTNDCIEYHQSYHEVTCLNQSSKKIQEDTETMRLFLMNSIIPFIKDWENIL